jgi:phage gp46-like protein
MIADWEGKDEIYEDIETLKRRSKELENDLGSLEKRDSAQKMTTELLLNSLGCPGDATKRKKRELSTQTYWTTNRRDRSIGANLSNVRRNTQTYSAGTNARRARAVARQTLAPKAHKECKD